MNKIGSFLKQGSEYEEDKVKDEDIPDTKKDAEESMRDDPAEKGTDEKKEGIPLINVLIIGGAALVAVIVFMFWVAGKKSASTQDTTDSKTGEMSMDDMQKKLDSNGTGTVVNVEDKQAEDMKNSVDDTAVELRKWGFTGDEIEYAETYGLSTDDMIKQAKEQQLSVQRELMKKASDAASPEYKKLLAMTYLGNKDLEIKKIPAKNGYINKQESSSVKNVDYVKCKATGQQLFIRLNLGKANKAFMAVPPDRWVTLKKSGNIVVRITYMEYGKAKVITAIEEVKTDEDGDVEATDDPGSESNLTEGDDDW